ncbi:hypothetical protein GGD81_004100 [Rhodobium orientis]|uniref:Lipoprotein n=1 Tax=Rhodobium orientis TaxID=34017 RepID=A0A327JMB1_9HYPH|nr:hypothetical protein [Rhodobium orientis]MBB4305034.1 hypothetical protein [Rhodobium orientis]MBK5948760.1 hypothetical protein [Rhodobium orientis]RAI26474.1 hypothetical protein CH339_14195 [Rhodobium orientis]
MKIATGIVGIVVGLLVLLQSCAVGVGSNLVNDQATLQAGSVGVLVGFLFFVAGAFAFGLPVVSMVIFAASAVCPLKLLGLRIS